VLTVEQLLSSPQAEFDKLFAFLGVNAIPVPDPLPRSNAWRGSRAHRARRRAARLLGGLRSLGQPAGQKDRYPALWDATARKLAESFATPNKELARDFGVDTTRWRSPG